jgi:trans-aconitate 2-methyltransferase
MSWNPAQYLKFAGPRLRPALDLLARVPDAPLAAPLAVDLGCGTGSATRLIGARWPDAEVVGVDASPSMLGSEPAPGRPRLRFEQADIAHWRAPAPAGLIFSNAALHWLDDHAALWPALLAQLAPGGVLAVQMPRNFDAPSHTLIAETVHAGPWRAQLAPLLRPVPVAPPRWHVERLAPRVSALDVWETEYLHLLEGPDPVKEWTKGTWLAPLLQALAGDEAAAFEADYARRLRAAYPPLPDGRTPFPFRRLFIVATR